MFGAIASWAFIGTFYLLVLTAQDYKNNCWIDSRHNYFMSGYTFFLLTQFSHTFKFILGVALVTVITSIVLKRMKVIGAGDIGALTWIIMGFAVINVYHLLWFYIIFSCLYILYYTMKRIICYLMKWDSKKGTPFFAVILISFICTCLLFGLY